MRISVREISITVDEGGLDLRDLPEGGKHRRGVPRLLLLTDTSLP